MISTSPRHGSREAAKTAKAAGLVRGFAPSREASRETILLPRRKESVVFSGEIAGFITAVVDRFQWPNQSLQPTR